MRAQSDPMSSASKVVPLQSALKLAQLEQMCLDLTALCQLPVAWCSKAAALPLAKWKLAAAATMFNWHW